MPGAMSVHSKKIAINALQDEAEGKKIVEWLKREINDAWDKKDTIDPSYESARLQRRIFLPCSST